MLFCISFLRQCIYASTYVSFHLQTQCINQRKKEKNLRFVFYLFILTFFVFFLYLLVLWKRKSLGFVCSVIFTLLPKRKKTERYVDTFYIWPGSAWLISIFSLLPTPTYIHDSSFAVCLSLSRLIESLDLTYDSEEKLNTKTKTIYMKTETTTKEDLKMENAFPGGLANRETEKTMKNMILLIWAGNI